MDDETDQDRSMLLAGGTSRLSVAGDHDTDLVRLRLIGVGHAAPWARREPGDAELVQQLPIQPDRSEDFAKSARAHAPRTD